jgi:hypothetical protein
LNYNDGTPVEDEKIALTQDEMLEKFGGFSYNPHWYGKYRGASQVYSDKNAILQIDHEEIDQEFIDNYREVLKERFQQEAIRITLQEITVA